MMSSQTFHSVSPLRSAERAVAAVKTSTRNGLTTRTMPQLAPRKKAAPQLSPSWRAQPPWRISWPPKNISPSLCTCVVRVRRGSKLFPTWRFRGSRKAREGPGLIAFITKTRILLPKANAVFEEAHIGTRVNTHRPAMADLGCPLSLFVIAHPAHQIFYRVGESMFVHGLVRWQRRQET